MITWCRSLAFIPLALLGIAQICPIRADDGAATWRHLKDKVDAIRQIEEQLPSLPDGAIFSEDKSDARAQIRDLMREAFAILRTSAASGTLDEYRRLEAEMSQQRSIAADARLAKLGAPQQGEGAIGSTVDKAWSYVAGPQTKTDYDAQIADAEARVEQATQQQEKLKAEFVRQLADIGVDVPAASAEALLASVATDEYVSLASAYANIKDLVAALEESTAQSNENLEVARRYYGIYTVLLKILVAMQQDAESAISDQYLPQLARISDETAGLMDDARRQLRKLDTADHRRVLEANIEAQTLILQAAELYRQHLQQQLRAIQVARRETDVAVAVAENTEKTVALTADIAMLMREGIDKLDAVLSIKPPPLKPFESVELKGAFEELSRRLAGPSQ
jgi:hypothetical protein